MAKKKYFGNDIQPQCQYCAFGTRAKDGGKVLCEKRGLVNGDASCPKFSYSPLKRIPVKQLNFVGSLADEDIYIESAGDRAEKEAENSAETSSDSAKADKSPADTKSENETSSDQPIDNDKKD